MGYWNVCLNAAAMVIVQTHRLIKVAVDEIIYPQFNECSCSCAQLHKVF